MFQTQKVKLNYLLFIFAWKVKMNFQYLIPNNYKITLKLIYSKLKISIKLKYIISLINPFEYEQYHCKAKGGNQPK